MTYRQYAIGMAISFALLLLCHWAFAQTGQHGVGHAEMHDKYRTWKTPQGYSCCSDQDCRPTRAYKDMVDERWHALVDGQWVIIPPERVLDIPSPDGRSHVCALASGVVLCFVPGETRI